MADSRSHTYAMDLERIKQNFRLRSGRSHRPKKTASGPVTAPSSARQVPQKTELANGILTPSPQPQPKSSSPEVVKGTEHSNIRVQNSEEPRVSEQPTSDGRQINSSQGAEEDCRSSLPHAVTAIPRHVNTREDSELRGATSKPSRRTTEPMHDVDSSLSEADDFDLNPPKPRPKAPSLETLAELLFSAGHLNFLLHSPPDLARFSAFLQKYIPHHYPLLSQYLETQKAIKAIEYANALAEGLQPRDTGLNTTLATRHKAAILDADFESISSASFKALVGEALPAFVTYSLIKTVSECLTDEIIGRNAAIMRAFVGGLSEVFCLTDPNQPDNPIIYASEEFYRLTRYGPEDVINSNCRFLQGRKTNPDSPKRLKAAIVKGEEVYETLLNYRRDGKPFVNLLMIAPLHDKNGKIKYHIGAQIDVTGLVQGNRALESFQRFLSRRAELQSTQQRQSLRRGLDGERQRKSYALEKLRELSEMFDLEESAVVQAGSRASSLNYDDDEDMRSIGSIERTARRVFDDSDGSTVDDEQRDDQRWELGQAGDGRLSGKLPGVYDSFMLLRPAPSLRIVFVSPRLRKIGSVLQTPFMSHVAAPSGTLTGLTESLKAGVPVSAKIHFMPQRGENRDGTILRNGTRHEDGHNGKAVWVSMTPLLGADDRVGVWMCLVVEKSKIGPPRRLPDPHTVKQAEKVLPSVENQPSQGAQRARGRPQTDTAPGQPSHMEDKSQPRNRAAMRDRAQPLYLASADDDLPIRPVRVDSSTVIKKGAPENIHKEGPEKEVEATKVVRQMGSVYFDAEGDQGFDKRRTEHDSNPSQTMPDEQLQSHRKLEHLNDLRVVLPPVEEYEVPPKNRRAYSVQVPGLGTQQASLTPTDEYITTRSPRMEPEWTHHRVMVEEDSDVPAESGTHGTRETAEPDSPRGRLRVRSRSDTPSPVWSPASDLSPSVPSSAQMGEDDDFALDVEPDTPRRETRRTSIDAEKGDEQVEKDVRRNQENSSGSPDTLRDIPRNRDKPHQDHDRDSAISMDSPGQIRGQSPNAHLQGIPPSATPLGQPQPEEPRVEVEESPDVTHEQDIETWVAEGRPASSHQNSSMRMDYLRAGSGRWPRPPKIDKDTMAEARAKGISEDGMTNVDWCARSPYSVD